MVRAPVANRALDLVAARELAREHAAHEAKRSETSWRVVSSGIRARSSVGSTFSKRARSSRRITRSCTPTGKTRVYVVVRTTPTEKRKSASRSTLKSNIARYAK
jgi:hypothetical protein